MYVNEFLAVLRLSISANAESGYIIMLGAEFKAFDDYNTSYNLAQFRLVVYHGNGLIVRINY